MHIHLGEEERAFNLADVDSITYTDLVISLSVEPEEIDFGEVGVGRVQNSNLTIRNTGNVNIIIDAIDLEEGVFSVDFENPVEINPEQSLELTVSFSPLERGDFATEMIVHSNSQDTPEVSIPLSGEGVNHFIFEITDVNMSILITWATINNELLVENDEVGIFTEDGLCAGGANVPAGFPEEFIGLAAFGAEEGMDNGFQDGESLTFFIWDASTGIEYATEIELVGFAEWEANGFCVCSLAAIID